MFCLVAFIFDHTDPNQWKHVRTADNPADSATRELPLSEISTFNCHGPPWLRQHCSEWLDTDNIKFDEQSLEAKSMWVHSHPTQVDINIIEWFTTYTKLVRSAVAKGPGQCTSLRPENSTSRNLPRSILWNLTPFFDDGILRVRNRFKHYNLFFDCKHPIILPQPHFITELVIHNSHQASPHGFPARGSSCGFQMENNPSKMYHVLPGVTSHRKSIDG